MLIGLYSSAPQSGKSAVASILCEDHNYFVIPFASTLKEMLRVLLLDLGVSHQESERLLFADKEEPLAVLGGKTCRYALQTIGTEWGRETIWSELWVQAWKQQVLQSRSVGQHLIVADDMRFPNEFDTIRSLGGINVRVRRPGATEKAGAAMNHASQGALDNYIFDYEIYNIGDLAALKKAVDKWVDALPMRGTDGSITESIAA